MGSGGQIVRVALAAGMVALAGMAAAGPCREDVVKLRGDGDQARFRVELADEEAEQRQGLMNRDSLASGAGMLFVYPEPQRVAFWMKNTRIPLDMIFLDAGGTVQKVHHEAVPHDETPIFGGDNIQSVLEINGGLARRIGIEAGWELRHPAIDQDRAAWPCSAAE
ncbi:DUF192 domain-containing protein [Roseovarius sp. D22-M7]|uniref:DUF192 domain-containing protein n=1 Tax=Roseovarius sp. D22-M7 TaxID=3127116 RepID=UPI003010441F